MRLASFDDVEQYLEELPWHSGDAMLTEAMWHVLKLAPTDPGVPLLLQSDSAAAIRSCQSSKASQHNVPSRQHHGRISAWQL